MRKFIFSFLSLVLIVYSFSGCTTQQKQLSDSEKLQQFFAKEHVNILITDSGLGGLSVFADLAERIGQAGIFKEVTLTYFNAQPHLKSGYNSMGSEEQKIEVFENALDAMQQNFKPDIILIACNTLSVLFPETKYSKLAEIPVVGVVETGVDLIAQKVKAHQQASVIIFATKTTVKKDAHREMLEKKGYDKSKLLTQACPKLAGAIERGSQSEETKNLVDKYVKLALKKFEPVKDPYFISFNCTHYGYISDLFKHTFEKYGSSPEEILDPNPYMANFMFERDYQSRYSATDVHLMVVSQPELPSDRIESIGKLIAQTSPATYDALKNYKFTPELFEWRSITGDSYE